MLETERSGREVFSPKFKYLRLNPLVDTQEGVTAGAFVGHILQVVHAAGEAAEAHRAQHHTRQPGKCPHVRLGGGGDGDLAMGADHCRGIGIEETLCIDDCRLSALPLSLGRGG